MATDRIYYTDPKCASFTARVIARRTVNGRPVVVLDRTAFYPTGGGQPHDTGTLAPAGDDMAAVGVVDVLPGEGEPRHVWHVLDRELLADEVVGSVDWDRRLDHMQQHTGQHVLSQAFIRVCGAETLAFHLGASASTIDVSRIDLEQEALGAVEETANAIIDAALPVTASIITPAELARVSLRKPPKVDESIRIVQVEGFDWSACGGTHVANTARIGQIKIVATERRGSELRVTFLCGRRARADHARLQLLADGLAARFATAQQEIPDAVDRLLAELDALRRENAELEREWAESMAATLWMQAPEWSHGRVVTWAGEHTMERAKRVAQALRSRPGTIAFIGVRGERSQLIFTRSDDVALDVAALLRRTVAALGGKGGGRPDWAQGGVPGGDRVGGSPDPLDVVLTSATALVSAAPDLQAA